MNGYGTRPRIAPILVGLAVAFGGPVVLLSPIDRVLGPQDRMATKVLEQLVLWLFLAAIVAIVALWEKQDLASMWLRRFSFASLAWGVLFAATTIILIMPALAKMLRFAGLPGFEAGMAKILVLPVWLRIIAVITAGIVEDALFLGYGFTRIMLLTRNKWSAGIITVLLVSFLHLPHWGIGPVLAYFVAVGVAVAFFVWRKDLLANIVSHVIVDGMGLVIVPALLAP